VLSETEDVLLDEMCGKAPRLIKRAAGVEAGGDDILLLESTVTSLRWLAVRLERVWGR